MQRFELAAARAGGELGGLLVALQERSLHIAIVGDGCAGGEAEQQRRELHSTSIAFVERIPAAKSSAACASAMRSSTVRITVAVGRTAMPSERTLSAKISSSRSMTKPSISLRYSPATARTEGSLPSSRIIFPAETRNALPTTSGVTVITGAPGLRRSLHILGPTRLSVVTW